MVAGYRRLREGCNHKGDSTVKVPRQAKIARFVHRLGRFRLRRIDSAGPAAYTPALRNTPEVPFASMATANLSAEYRDGHEGS
jgi:hypothetical protein